MAEPEAMTAAEERLISDAHALLVGLMEREGLTRVELGRRLDKTKGFMSHILSGERNLTLRTLADCLHVMGYRLTLGVEADLTVVLGDQDTPA
jgi:transcriptional regulator with XRE-family HTH domain